jgi:hypothetical protein
MRNHLKIVRRRMASWAVAGLAALVLAGCATEAQVKRIVSDSNAVLLASRLPEAELVLPDQAPDNAAAEIEDFIARHPEQVTLNAALRVRQAIVYLARKEYNQADAAFKAAQRLGVVTDRDQALVAVHEHLIWWYENSQAQAVDPARSAAARKAFVDEARRRGASPDIRDFLAEGSAWLGFREFNSTLAGRPAQRQLLEQTVNDYAFILDASDLEWLCKPAEHKGVDVPLALRRRLRAQAVLRRAAVQAEELRTSTSAPTFASPVLQELIGSSSTRPLGCAPLPKA